MQVLSALPWFGGGWGVVTAGLRGNGGFSSPLGLAQQAGQRDAPPGGGFEVSFFIRVWGFVSLALAARPLP